MDVRLPDFKAMVHYGRSMSQIEDWANKFHKAKDFYEKTRGGGAIIFIMDTAGTFQDHSDLKANNDTRLNGNATPDPDEDRESGHGTHSAGISAAVDNNDGVIGIAPDAKLGARKVLNDSGQGSYSWIAQEIYNVANLRLPEEYKDRKKIISMSLGGSSPSATLEKAIDYAISKGCFVIAAAGNSGYTGDRETVGYPANYPQVIAVASIDKQAKPSSFSSGGKNVDIAAYGNGNYSTYKNNTYATLRGTSMATPVISGLAALIVSAYPEIDTQAKLMEYFKDNAEDIFTDGFDVRTGYGTLKADAFEDPDLGDTPEPDPDPTPEPTPDPTPEPPSSNPIKGKVDLWLDKTYEVRVRNADEPTWQTVKVKVAASADVKNESDLKAALGNVERFFGARGFYFTKGTGVDLYADWIARFLYVVTKRWGTAIVADRVWIDKGGLKIAKDVSPKKLELAFTETSSDDTIEIEENKTFTLKKEEQMKTEQLILQIPVDKIVIDRDANLPIDVLKEVVGDGFGVADALFDVFGGETAKGLMQLAGIVGKYEDPKSAFATAWAQAGDLSEDESKELYAFVTDRFDIEDDELEAKIERILKLPITGYAEYLDTVDTFLEIRAIWNDPTTSRWAKVKALTKYGSTDVLDQGEDLFDLITEFVAAFRDLFKKK